MSYDQSRNYEDKRNASEVAYSKKIKAGKRRTYFFDVRETRGSDYFITITESKKRMNDDGYDRHKMFLYKEDFNKFLSALTETVNFVKTDLMPDFDFDAFNHDEQEHQYYSAAPSEQNPAEPTILDESFAAPSAVEDASIDEWKM